MYISYFRYNLAGEILQMMVLFVTLVGLYKKSVPMFAYYE